MIRDRKEYSKKYYLLNKERISLRKKTDLYKQRHAIREKERYDSEKEYRIAHLLRCRLRKALKRDSKIGSAVRDLGCSIPELKFYLEGKFIDGMSWGNHGKWHIDHVIPLTYFDLTDHEQFLQAVHYTNLQPLWAVDNIRKNNKVVYSK